MIRVQVLFGAMVIWSVGCTSSSVEFLDDPVDTTVPTVPLVDSMPVADPIGIEFGSSAGECVGYCIREFVLHSWGVTGIRKTWPNTGPILPVEKIWMRVSGERMELVIAEVHSMTALMQHEHELVGCPDCADGGACWLKVQRNGSTRSLSFDRMHGAARWDELVKLIWRLEPYPIDPSGTCWLPNAPKWERS